VTHDAAIWASTLITLNLSFLATVDESNLDWEISAWWLAWLLLEALILSGIQHFQPQKLAPSVLVSAGNVSLTVSASLAGIATAFLALMSLIRRDPVLGGLFWASAPMFGIAVLRPASTISWLLIISAVALGVSLIERSYWIAYFDELTGLRGRRALNETFNALGEQYCIAVVDVDHFKSFNDTYGHDIGDQVLRKVAGQLARVTGGGQAFRCGGEEFVVVFKNKSAQQALTHSEKLRQAIEDDVFHVRGPDRSKRERPERRRTNKMRAQREACTVTVSIGLAEAPEGFSPQQVYKAADRALYRAKNNGRNRVEVARRSTTAATEFAAEKA
jgi:GGDEF domain-containing protein